MVLNQLPATIDERLHIRFERVDGVAVHFLRARNVGGGIELLHRPGRVGEHEEAELIETGSSRRCRPSGVGPAQLAARKKAGDLASGLVILHAGIYQPRRLHLCRAEAVGFAGAAALQYDRIERASHRVLEQAVGHAVERVAGLDDRAMQQLTLRLQQAARRVLVERLRDAHGLGRPSGPVKARRAGDDAVEVRREALGFGHRLPAARGAPVEVRELRRGAIVSGHDLLRGDGHLVNRAPTEIDQFFRVSQREARAVAGVAGVSRRCGVTARERPCHGGIGDRTAEPAVAHGLEFAVPARGRQPDFNLDVRVAGRLQRCGHPAERG